MNFDKVGFKFGHDYRQDGTCVYCGHFKTTIVKGELFCGWIVRACQRQYQKEKDDA